MSSLRAKRPRPSQTADASEQKRPVKRRRQSRPVGIAHGAASFILYEYQRLTGNDEIRLLKIQSVGEDDWAYSIEHTHLHSAPPFETISYVWGPENRRNVLVLDSNTVLLINDNLNEALPYLAKQCQTGYLWIDQVCIDQSSTEERNHQVKIMGSIYKRGVRVFAWLGAGPRMNADMQELIHICRTSLAAGETVPFMEKKLFTKYSQRNLLLLSEVHKILTNEWFSRAWVFQEIVLSKQGSFVLGYVTFQFLAIVSIAKVAALFLNRPATKSPLDQRTESLAPSRRSYWYAQITGTPGHRILSRMHYDWSFVTLSLLHNTDPQRSWIHFVRLLSTVSPISEATDPRDAVYAFLGLQLDPDICVEPDYTTATENVLVHVASSIIKGSRSLDILAYASRHTPCQGSRSFLPSWVPNWKAQILSPVMKVHGCHSRVRNTARYHLWCDAHVTHELHVNGVRIDTVDKVFEPGFQSQVNGEVEDLQSYIALDDRLSQVQKYADISRSGLFSVIMACPFEPDLVQERFVPRPYYDNDYYLTAYDDYVRAMNDATDVHESGSILSLRYLTYLASGKHLFVTKGGQVGLAAGVEAGDVVYALSGCSTLVVLRSTSGSESSGYRFTLVGMCYLGNPGGKVPDFWDVDAYWMGGEEKGLVLV